MAGPSLEFAMESGTRGEMGGFEGYGTLGVGVEVDAASSFTPDVEACGKGPPPIWGGPFISASSRSDISLSSSLLSGDELLDLPAVAVDAGAAGAGAEIDSPSCASSMSFRSSLLFNLATASPKRARSSLLACFRAAL